MANKNRTAHDTPSPSIPSELAFVKPQSSLRSPSDLAYQVEEQLKRKGDIGEDYTLLTDLGEGTFGSVKLGKRTSNGVLVAVKILEKSRIRD